MPFEEGHEETPIRRHASDPEARRRHYVVPVFRPDVPGDEVTEAIQHGSQLVADQWSRFVGVLAAIFAKFTIDAEGKAGDVIDVPGFLRLIALRYPVCFEEEDSDLS